MIGIVIKSTGSWYNVLTADGRITQCRIKGKFRTAGIKNTNPVAVGDNVEFVIESNENTGIISGILPRKNYIIRRSTKLSKQTHIIAANIDEAFLVATLAMPRTSTGFIDRFLLTAEAYGIKASIVFNKSDIYTEEGKEELFKLKGIYEPLGYKCFIVSSFDKTGINELADYMRGKICLIAGHSGVGKSSLINAIEPDLNLKINKLSDAHEKGLHTTTFAEMFLASRGGYIIDTPGIKEFGIIDIEKNELGHFFPEIRDRMNDCKFNSCLHVNEPGCAVIKAVEENEIASFRYNTYLSILLGEELKKEYE